MRGSMLEEVEDLSLSTRTRASSSKPDEGSDDDVGNGNGTGGRNRKRPSGGGAGNAKKSTKKAAADGPEVAAAKLKSTSVSAIISVTDKLRKQKLALADALHELTKEASEEEIPDSNKELLQQRWRMVALAFNGHDEGDGEQAKAKVEDAQCETLDQNRDCHKLPCPMGTDWLMLTPFCWLTFWRK